MPAKKPPTGEKKLPPPSPHKLQKPPTPRQAVHRNPLKVFIENDINREKLRSIATDPVFLAACHYIAQRLAPTEMDVLTLCDLTLRAKTAAHRVALSFPEELEKLIHHKAAHSEPEAWGHIIPEPQ